MEFEKATRAQPGSAARPVYKRPEMSVLLDQSSAVILGFNFYTSSPEFLHGDKAINITLHKRPGRFTHCWVIKATVSHIAEQFLRSYARRLNNLRSLLTRQDKALKRVEGQVTF